MKKKVSISDYLLKFQDLRKLPNENWELLRGLMHDLGRQYYERYPDQLHRIRKSLQQLSFLRKEPLSENLLAKVLSGIFDHYTEKLFNIVTSESSLQNFIKTRSGNHGLTTLRHLLKGKRGVLLISGHVGGIELIPAYLCCNGIPSAIVAKFNNPELLKVSEKQSSRFPNRIINAGSGSQILRNMFDQLRDNRVVITLCDEMKEWRPYKDRAVDFLGKTVRLDRTLDLIYRHQKPAVVFALLHRQENCHYKMMLTPLVSPYVENEAHRDISVSASSLSTLDQYIRRFPEGWYQWSKFDQIQDHVCEPSPDIQDLPLYESDWNSQSSTA